MLARTIASLLFMVAVPLAASAEVRLLDKAVEGAPPLKSIDVLGFGPEGVLLIGDGRGAQIVAVRTNDTQPQTPLTGRIAKFQGALAAKLGTNPAGIEVIDLAVNPASGRAYIAVRKQDDKSNVILTTTGAGDIEEFALDKVTFVRLPLTASNNAPIGRITDVAWADDRVIAAAATNEEFASKIFSIPVPLVHESQGRLASAETYHVAHHRWETKAPMSVILPFREEGKLYIAGAFACTPVVKYPVDDITADAKVKGTSVVELGNGNRPIDMIAYEKGGREYILSNTFRMHHEKRPFGPSPYWTVRFDRSLLSENDNVNEKALLRLNSDYKPATDKIQMIDALHGVVQLDKLSNSQALVLRTGDGQLDLEVVALP